MYLLCGAERDNSTLHFAVKLNTPDSSSMNSQIFGHNFGKCRMREPKLQWIYLRDSLHDNVEFGGSTPYCRHQSSLLNGATDAIGNWGLAACWDCYNVSVRYRTILYRQNTSAFFKITKQEILLLFTELNWTVLNFSPSVLCLSFIIFFFTHFCTLPASFTYHYASKDNKVTLPKRIQNIAGKVSQFADNMCLAFQEKYIIWKTIRGIVSFNNAARISVVLNW